MSVFDTRLRKRRRGAFHRLRFGFVCQSASEELTVCVCSAHSRQGKPRMVVLAYFLEFLPPNPCLLALIARRPNLFNPFRFGVIHLLFQGSQYRTAFFRRLGIPTLKDPCCRPSIVVPSVNGLLNRFLCPFRQLDLFLPILKFSQKSILPAFLHSLLFRVLVSSCISILAHRIQLSMLVRPQVPFLMRSELADSLDLLPQIIMPHGFTTPSESAICLRTTWRTRSDFFPSKFDIPGSIFEISANGWAGAVGTDTKAKRPTLRELAV